MSRSALWLIALVLLAVGLFYAFNAYIQLRERGFAEPWDVPIAVAGLLLGLAAAWRARRTPRT